LLLAVRAGGHNVAGLGTCEDGLVLDLRAMRAVRVDPAARRAWCQGGAVWAEFDQQTQEFGLATTGGVVSTTGVAGLTLGGGIGWLTRKHGTACDNLTSVDLVTADGELITVSADREPELFWGLRGGGGNFGVAVGLEFAVHPVGPVVYSGALVYPVDQARDVLAAWSKLVGELPEEAATIAVLRTAPANPPYPQALHGRPVLVIATLWAGDAAQGAAGLAPVRALGDPVADTIGGVPYLAVQAAQDRYWAPGAQNYWKGDYLAGLDEDAVACLAGAAESFTSPASDIKLVPMAGGVRRAGADASAFGHHDARILFAAGARWSGSSGSDQHVAWARDLWAGLRRLADGVYVNFLGEEGDERVREAYGTRAYQRLAALKDRWDPDNVFRVNQNITPASHVRKEG
jgi:FAD/FMN-containing dehydrogenase